MITLFHYYLKYIHSKHYYISEERLFSTLFDLVCYYFDTGDGLTVRMTKPGLVAGPEGPRRIRESDITIGEQIGHGHFGEGIGNSRGDISKVGCAFPMVILSDFRMGKQRDDDHEEDAPYFRIRKVRWSYGSNP